jgi:hypothetical protein
MDDNNNGWIDGNGLDMIGDGRDRWRRTRIKVVGSLGGN